MYVVWCVCAIVGQRGGMRYVCMLCGVCVCVSEHTTVLEVCLCVQYYV